MGVDIQVGDWNLGVLSDLVEVFPRNPEKTRLQGLFRLAPRDEASPADSAAGIVRWDTLTYGRELAPVGAPGGPAIERAKPQQATTKTDLARILLSAHISAEELYNERAPGSISAQADLKIKRAATNLKIEIDNTIEYMCARLLAGSLVVSPANIPGSQITLPAIAPAVQAFNAAASWANAATLIFSSSVELEGILDLAKRNSGRPIRRMIIPPGVRGYLTNNAEVQAWLAQAVGDRIAQSELVMGDALAKIKLGGVNWEVYDEYYTLAGVVTAFMPGDLFYALPGDDDLAASLGMGEGYGFVPQEILRNESGIGTATAPTPGFYSFTVWATKPPLGVDVFVGWTGMPIVKHPAAIILCNPTP